MPHIGDVHDMAKLKAVHQKGAAEFIHENIGSHVSDVSVAVYSRTAGIDFYQISFAGGEFFFGSGECVIKFHREILPLFCRFACISGRGRH